MKNNLSTSAFRFLVVCLIVIMLATVALAQDRREGKSRVSPTALNPGERYLTFVGSVFSTTPVGTDFTSTSAVSRTFAIVLPHRSKLKRLDLIGVDDTVDVIFEMTLELVSVDMSGNETIHYTVDSSSGSSSSARRIWYSPRGSVKMLGNRAYFFRLTLPDGTASNDLICGMVRIIYE